MTIYAQMPDTLALNVKGQVRVADVTVGTVSVAAVLPIPAKGRRHFGLSRVLARGEEYLWEYFTRGRMRDAKTKFNTQRDRELLWDLSMQSLTAVGDEINRALGPFALQSAEARRPDHRNDGSSCTGTIHG
jgi:hypothetical protein